MKQHTVWTALYGLLLFLQAGLMGAMLLLEELTHRKAGVNHHLYYRRAQFNRNVLTPQVRYVLTALLMVAILCLLLYLWKKRGGALMLASGGIAVLWMAVTVLAFYLELFRSKYVYPYLMAAFAAAIVLSLANMAVAARLQRGK